MRHVSFKLYSLEYKKKMLKMPNRLEICRENVKRWGKLVEMGNFIALPRHVQEKDLLRFLEAENEKVNFA